MKKTILLASFIFPERIEWYINYLNNKFNIPKNKVFGYKNLDDESKLIVTFRLTLENDRVNLKKLFPNAIIIHKKGDALYTINALNNLIDLNNENSKGNTDYKSVKIDWSDFQNKFLLSHKKELTILNIKRVF